ncbi:angiopoietin-related protein 7-like [Orbicella faveolata]|uniref:angiopoietin-related protein 7-like n=1 Tax=Orbicella faveolata TaxID=48498 RepID=UPI0009E2BFC2|nr:angiopoietin-related protein 7-like [Orbicella faveolata]
MWLKEDVPLDRKISQHFIKLTSSVFPFLSLDIDECSTNSHSCDANAICNNTEGGHNCACKDGFIGNGRNCTGYYKNCAEVYKSGQKISGVYKIDPDGLGEFEVFCDHKTTSSGWTVFQKRLDGSVDFYRGWDDYKRGFGNLNGEFWLGLDKIHRLTKQRSRLRVDLEDTIGKTAYAEYDFFDVASENSKYKLSLGTYSGTAGDSLSYHRGSAFSTKDRDNDKYSGSCATIRKGAWWFNSCNQSDLNGVYYHGQHSSPWAGVQWYHWKGEKYSAKRAEMKIKPVKN